MSLSLFKEAQDKALVMQAFANGQTIESKSKESNNWQEDYFPSWNWEEYDYQVKAKKKWRPFENSKEVPIGLILIREKGETERFGLIVAVIPEGFVVPTKNKTGVAVLSFVSCFTKDEISLDGGKTWQPCGVEES